MAILFMGGRAFGASRSKGGRFHVGVDIYGNKGDPIVACEAGRIINYYHFYRGTFALLIKNNSGTVINYAEVAGTSLSDLGLSVGDPVVAVSWYGAGGCSYSSSVGDELFAPRRCGLLGSYQSWAPGGRAPRLRQLAVLLVVVLERGRGFGLIA